MDTREDIPRISVGSAQDWEKLKIKYRKEAIEILEKYIPADGLGNERDALMRRANEIIDQTFRIAQSNIRINGQNFELLGDGMGSHTEQFDEALDRRIWSLAATRLQWQKKIAQTRRKFPSEMETVLQHLLEEQRTVEMDPEEIVPDSDVDDAEAGLPQIQKWSQPVLALGEELSQTIPVQEERSRRFSSVTSSLKRSGEI